jgi:hypothetical protein
MKYEYISHIPKQLEQAGYKPKSVKENDKAVEIRTSECRFVISKESTLIEAYILINSDLTFDIENVEYLEDKGIDDWSIYKHILTFTYAPKNEKDMLHTLIEVLRVYD